MKILAIVCQKGGVGKSTLAINLSSAFSLMESFENPQDPGKTLLVDMDSQHHSSKTLSGGVFGVDGRSDENERLTLGSFLMGKTPLPLTTILEESHLPLNNKAKNLHYLPSESQGMEEAENYLRTEITGPFRLADLLIPLAEIYKYIVIDTPPDLSIMTENALLAATHVIIPIDLKAFSVEALIKTLDKIEQIQSHPRFNPRLQIAGIAVAKGSLWHGEEAEWLKVLTKRYGDLILPPVAMRVDINTAQTQGLDIFTYKPPRDPEAISSSSIATQEYAKLAEEIKKRIDNT